MCSPGSLSSDEYESDGEDSWAITVFRTFRYTTSGDPTRSPYLERPAEPDFVAGVEFLESVLVSSRSKVGVGLQGPAGERRRGVVGVLLQRGGDGAEGGEDRDSRTFRFRAESSLDFLGYKYLVRFVLKPPDFVS